MYKIILDFKDTSLVFTISNIDDLDDLLKTYPDYTRMSLERIKTLKR